MCYAVSYVYMGTFIVLLIVSVSGIRNDPMATATVTQP